MPTVLEVSFIRSDLVTARPSRTVYPTALDRPNYHRCPDHLLHFFPFLPWNDGQIAEVIASAGTGNASSLGSRIAAERILVDVKSLQMFAVAGHTLTGIQRVELGLARELVKYGDQPVAWDETDRAFRTVDLDMVQRLLTKTMVDLNTILSQPVRFSGSRRKEIRRLRIFATLLSFIPAIGSLRRRLAKRVITLFARNYLEIGLEERQRISRRLKLGRRHERRHLFIAAAEKSEFHGQVLVPAAGDLLLLPSVLPSENCMSYIEKNKVKIAPLVYDLYVFNQPHLVQYADVIRGMWASALPRYAQNSRMILSCSENTKQELTAWFAASGLQAPQIECIALAPGLDRQSPCAKPASFPFHKDGFVLLVGSFGPNKNQAWAHMLWSRLIARLGARTLPLVFAGLGGWRAQDTIESIRQDVHYGERLFVVEGPSDAELAWLYSNCSFIIQPSETEGWGLPVSEALAFGKPCLTSGRGALHESGQGVAWEADPLDGAKWLEKLSELMTDPTALGTERERTRRQSRIRTWKDVADDIRAVLIQGDR